MDVAIGAVAGLAIAAVLLVIFTLVFRWIWNNVVPEVFGLKEITFWQAIGILILASILFGGHRVVHIQQPTTSTEVVEKRRSDSSAPSWPMIFDFCLIATERQGKMT